MAHFQFCPGHLSGRAGLITDTNNKLKSVFSLFNVQFRRVFNDNDYASEDVLTLFGFMRIGDDLCRELDTYVAELHAIEADGRRKEREKREAEEEKIAAREGRRRP